MNTRTTRSALESPPSLPFRMATSGIIARILIIIIVSEIVVMGILRATDIPVGWTAAILDALLLALISAPMLYFAVVRGLARRLADVSVRTELASLEAIHEATAALIIVLDPHGRVVRFNRTCEEVSGYDRRELVGTVVWDKLLDQAEAPAVRAVFDRLAAGQFPIAHENYWVTKKGERRRIAWSNSAIARNGSVELVIGTGLDITGQREIEQRLSNFQMGIERSTDVVFLTDREGKIQYTNPAFETVYGYTAEEALGSTPRLIKSGLLTPDVYEQFWSTLLAKQVVTGEIINKSKDGELLTMDSSANPVLDESGDVIGYLAVQRDVTKRVAAEAALRESEQRFRSLSERVPLGVGVIALDGTVLYANPALADLLGYTPEEMAGRSVSEYQYEADRARATVHMRQIAEGGASEPHEYRLVHRDGAVFVTEISSRLLDFEGRPALLSTIKDLTQQRQLEEGLRQSQKMEAVGQLAGGIAHDFNNLLTVIQTSSEMVAPKMPTDDPETVEDLRELQDAVQRGRNLIKKLLAFGRREELMFRAIDLNALLRDFESTLRRLIPEHIEIAVTQDEAARPIWANPGSVEQILMNLATNSRDAMPHGGRLAITTKDVRIESSEAGSTVEPGQFVRLSVSDTGHGMDEQTKAKLFEPFFTKKLLGGGTGLGMAVVYGLVKQHGGAIDVASAPGMGTTTTMYLPIARSAVSADGQVDDAHWKRRAPRRPFSSSRTSLAIRRGTERTLTRLGYKVLTAQDGYEALEVFDEHREEIDVILTDLIMPRMGGRTLFEVLSVDEKTVPFVFASGYAPSDLTGDIPTAPGVSALPKPWTIAELATTIRWALDGSVVSFPQQDGDGR